jgi:PAS domain-containing protein
MSKSEPWLELAQCSRLALTLSPLERRHNILKPQRTPSGQRRYSADDIELLREVINGVVVRGLTLKVAVRAAHGRLDLQGEETEPANRSEPPAISATPDAADVPWRAVADFLPELIAILDEEGCVVDGNVALASAAGRLREQLRGARFVDFTDPYDRAKAVTAFRPPFHRRHGWELNMRLPALRGLFAFDCVPVRYEDRRLLIAIGRGISPPVDAVASRGERTAAGERLPPSRDWEGI